jgi:hypothetical protein
MVAIAKFGGFGWYAGNHTLLLLPNTNHLQQVEDYIIGCTYDN